MISFTGLGTPRFESTSPVLDYTPTGEFQHTIRDELVDANITRPSIKDGSVKVIVKGQWVRNQYIFRETKANIDAFIAVAFEEIDFTPDTDKGFKYEAIVEGVEIDDTDPLRVFLTVTVISKDYCDPGTYIEVTDFSVVSRGEDVTITWDSHNITNVDIELWKGGVYDSDIVSDTTDDGSYTWSIAAAETLGTDYQIKIIDNDSGAYDFSEEFEITYNGYYDFSPGGYITIDNRLTTLGDEFTFAFWYNRQSEPFDINGYFFRHIDGGYREVISIGENYGLQYWTRNGGTNEVSIKGSLPFDSDWHYVILSIKHSTAYAKIYADGVDVTSVETVDSGYIHDTGGESYCLSSGGNYVEKWFKKVTISSSIWTEDQRDLFGGGGIPTDNLKLLYLMNEAAPDEPPISREGWTQDKSGNDYDGTPENIDGTFFNQT